MQTEDRLADAAPESADGNKDIDLAGLMRAARRQVWFGLIVFVVVAGATLTVLRTRPAMYEASAMVLVQSRTPRQTSLPLAAGGLLGLDFGSSPSITEKELLQARDGLVATASELGRVVTTPRETQELEDQVHVSQITNTDLLVIHVKDHDPAFAADFANLLVDRRITETLDETKADARDTASYIEQLMAQMRGHLTDAAGEIRKYKTDNDIVDPEAEASEGLRSLADLGSQAAAARAERTGAAEQANMLRRELEETNQVSIEASTIARNPLVGELEASLAKLEAQCAGREATRGGGDAELRELHKAIDSTQAQLSQAVETLVVEQVSTTNPQYLELARMLAAAESQSRAFDARAKALESTYDRVHDQLAMLPTVEEELGTLEQDARASVEVYKMLFSRYHEMKVNEALVRPALKLVTRAVVPDSPTLGPIRQLAASILAGMLAAALLGAVRDARDSRLRDAYDMERRLGIAVLGTVPRLRRGAELGLTSGTMAARLADSFRAIRASLPARDEAGAKVVLVTGVAGREGASTLTACLGAACAWEGRRVLVIDANLRSPALHELLGVQPQPGLSEVLTAAAEAAHVTLDLQDPALALLAAGDDSAAAVDLLGSERFVAVLAEARRLYDTVLVDSAPSHEFPEAATLAPLCDAVVLVVRPGVSTREGVSRAVCHLAELGAKLMGAVIMAEPGPAVGSAASGRRDATSPGRAPAEGVSGDS
jgi:capsular exopolysaccharide synthesis family protein